MRICVLISCAVLSCPAAPSADDMPDFTGVWKYTGSGSTVTHKIDHHNSSLRIHVESQFNAGRLAGSFSGGEEYVIGGAEKVSKTDGGRETWATAHWQGTSLVVQRVVKDGYRVTVTRDLWTLSADRATLTRTRRTINMDGVSETTHVYLRQ